MVTRWQRAALLAALATTASCKTDPTGLMLIVDVDAMLREMMRTQGPQTINVAVTYQGRNAPAQQTYTVRSWPATVGVELASADRDVLVEVRLALGGAPASSIVGRALVTPAAEKVLAVPISLWGMCRVEDRPPSFMETDCRYPRLTGGPVLTSALQTLINRSATNVRQITSDPALHTCGMDGVCPAQVALAATQEYQPALANTCESGARRVTCEMGMLDGGMPPTDAGPPPPEAAVPASDSAVPPADHGVSPTPDASTPTDGSLLPDILGVLDGL